MALLRLSCGFFYNLVTLVTETLICPSVSIVIFFSFLKLVILKDYYLAYRTCFVTGPTLKLSVPISINLLSIGDFYIIGIISKLV